MNHWDALVSVSSASPSQLMTHPSDDLIAIIHKTEQRFQGATACLLGVGDCRFGDATKGMVKGNADA